MMELVFLLLVLACPLAMLLMMRGGHGHGGHAHGGFGSGAEEEGGGDVTVSTDELRVRRDELDRLIVDREERRERQECGAGR